MICPSCGHDNIEGMDRCENCMKSLRDLDVPRADATGGLVRSVMEDDLGRLIEGESLTVSAGESVGEVVKRMKQMQAGCALVIADDHVAGIFTEHDILCRLAGMGEDALRASIDELMTPNPETLKESDSVAAALNKMSIGRYRNLPVRRNDGSYAVVSIQHVLNYIAQEEW